MNELQAFNFEGNQIRTEIDDAGAVWFVASDVCKSIGLSDTNKALARIPSKHKGTKVIRTLGGPQEMSVVSEPGLYRLGLRSNKAQAERFQDWVTEDVLPAIRKTGTYSNRPLSIDERLSLALESAVDTRRQLSQVKTEIQEVRALAIQASSHNSANTGFMTIRGYCNVHKIRLSLDDSKKMGKACASLARSMGAKTREADDEMFGSVKAYPYGILEEVFKQASLKEAL